MSVDDCWLMDWLFVGVSICRIPNHHHHLIIVNQNCHILSNCKQYIIGPIIRGSLFPFTRGNHFIFTSIKNNFPSSLSIDFPYRLKSTDLISILASLLSSPLSYIPMANAWFQHIMTIQGKTPQQKTLNSTNSPINWIHQHLPDNYITMPISSNIGTCHQPQYHKKWSNWIATKPFLRLFTLQRRSN